MADPGDVRACIKAPSAIAGPDAAPDATAETPKDNQYSGITAATPGTAPLYPTPASGRGRLSSNGTSIQALDESDGDDWVSRRDPRIRRPLRTIGHTAAGIPFLAPEIQLFYQAKDPRPKDKADVAVILPLLDERQRAWLDMTLVTFADHPDG